MMIVPNAVARASVHASPHAMLVIHSLMLSHMQACMHAHMRCSQFTRSGVFHLYRKGIEAKTSVAMPKPDASRQKERWVSSITSSFQQPAHPHRTLCTFVCRWRQGARAGAEDPQGRWWWLRLSEPAQAAVREAEETRAEVRVRLLSFSCARASQAAVWEAEGTRVGVRVRVLTFSCAHASQAAVWEAGGTRGDVCALRFLQPPRVPRLHQGFPRNKLSVVF